ncbi:hypothetical protein JTE90_020540 [Oedothorax gibbosus]|uniref:TROVE domain-containing protein n=1 Tax=Oedothorax gibbosus TaxID=931172 RepID=A0AAV6VXU6_9ARAC|nr:hypothetical protein JTE90_020540 [Oedothorax gibbosus]
MAIVSDSNLLRLRRFLYLGDESQIYPLSVTYPFNPNITQCIQELIDSNLQEEAIAEIKRAYNNEHFLGFETLVYALVVLGHAKDFQIRKLALLAGREICTTAASVLTFTHFYKEASKPSKGWGRGHRRFLIDWYNGKDAKDLAVEVTKVKTRYKWSHKDILCMAHIKAKNEALGAVFKYLVKGLEIAKRECESAEAEPVLSYLKSFYELSHSTDPIQAAGLVEVNEFCFEQIPSKIIKSKEVSLCVIPKLPLQNLLDLLSKFNKVGLLKPNSSHSTAVLERLASEETLADT